MLYEVAAARRPTKRGATYENPYYCRAKSFSTAPQP
jgi:hypothetical protein